MKDVISKKTTWFLVNIKAKRNQNTHHYVEVFKELYKKDPMIKFPRGKYGSLKSMELSNILENDNEPKWIKITLLSYTIVDSDAFYNKKSQENVQIDNWDNNIVANKKEVDLYFIPSVHTLAFKCSSEISPKNIVLYLEKALNKVESESFDVNIIVERDVLNKILNAHAVYSIEAKLSYSNPGHSDEFAGVFDDKLREMEPNQFNITAKGTKEHPLNRKDDGMLEAIVNLSERNGIIKASIRETNDSRVEKIDSSEHPKRLVLNQIIDGVASTIYNAVKNFIR